MKRIVHSRLLCTILMLSMLVLGIYCEDIHANSSFLHVSDSFNAASLQAADHVADTHIFYENSSLSLIQEFVLSRQSARPFTALRISLYLIFALLLVNTDLLYLSFKNSCLCTDAYKNQYRYRTLDYIHKNDGKKSHIA
ncbi:MAG: hypothetical protein K2L86_08235 [Lachnospiraceae bacterium]|nr:hypothetical protein [Lachnospiraceae bacterium]